MPTTLASFDPQPPSTAPFAYLKAGSSTPSLMLSSSTSTSTVTSEEALSDRDAPERVVISSSLSGSGIPLHGSTSLPHLMRFDTDPKPSVGSADSSTLPLLSHLASSRSSSPSSSRIDHHHVSTPHASSSLSHPHRDSLFSSGTMTDTDLSSSGKRKRRRRTSPAELAVLEGHFMKNPLPSSIEREAIAAEVNMTARHVQIWFQNKRQTEKKRAPDLALPSSQGRNVCPTGALSAHPLARGLPKSTFSSESDDPFSEQPPSFPVSVNKENVPPLFPLPAYQSSSSRSIPTKTQSGPVDSFRRTSVDGPDGTPVPSFVYPHSSTKSSPLFQRTMSESTTLQTPCSSRTPLPSVAASSSAPSMMDAVVQNRELPFFHSSFPPPSTVGPTREKNRMPPPSEWARSRSGAGTPVNDGRDLWKNMMSDPPSAGLLELNEGEDGVGISEDEDDTPKCIRVDKHLRPPSSVSSRTSPIHPTPRSKLYALTQRPSRVVPSSVPIPRTLPYHARSAHSQTPVLLSKLHQRTPLHKSASLDWAASRPPGSPSISALTFGPKRTPSSAPFKRRVPSGDLSVGGSESGRKKKRRVGEQSVSMDQVLNQSGTPREGAGVDATDEECARLLLGLLGGQ